MVEVNWGESKVKPIGRPQGMPVARRGELYHAVRDKCVDCMGHENYVLRIRYCQAEGKCPLWPFRPYQE